MIKRNVPQRAGRIRGHEAAPKNQAAQLVVEAMHRPSRRPVKAKMQQATAKAMGRAKRAATKFKPPAMGGEGRLPLQSPSTRRANLKNAKRKPSARRSSARKGLRG